MLSGHRIVITMPNRVKVEPHSFVRMCFVYAVILAVALFGVPVRGQDVRLNTLSQKQAAEGWILLFDGETTFGWTPRGAAQWGIVDGNLVAEGGAGVLATNTEFSDYELRAECWIDAQANSGIFLRAPTAGDVTQTNAYEVNLYDAHQQWPTGSINGVAKAMSRIRSVGRWTRFIVRAEGSHLTVLVGGKKTVDTRNVDHDRGVIALQYNGAGAVKFRQIMLRPLGQKSLFNGKNLAGWKPFAGGKSVYSVTPEGWLNVKSGPGDLQSESVCGDFVLQMEVYSNGDHLNSGVFFRAEPGVRARGYEIQIRNQWEGDDRSKPVDYGTGGLYNRQPARKVVPNDREWFTLTIAAHGNHFAAWVNGYQTADFTDTRPPNEQNARQGARTRPGILGLQGHDATTDLSFRRLRILELPKAM